MLDAELNFGELYMDGRIEVTQSTIFDVLMLAAANMWRPDGLLWVRLMQHCRNIPALRCADSAIRTASCVRRR